MALFAGDLLRMYQRFAEAQGWTFDLVEAQESELGGIKEAVVHVQGEGVFARLKYESGVHRVQRVPETESGGRIHTSAATVAVLPEAEEVELSSAFTVMRPGSGEGTSTSVQTWNSPGRSENECEPAASVVSVSSKKSYQVVVASNVSVTVVGVTPKLPKMTASVGSPAGARRRGDGVLVVEGAVSTPVPAVPASAPQPVHGEIRSVVRGKFMRV